MSRLSTLLFSGLVFALGAHAEATTTTATTTFDCCKLLKLAFGSHVVFPDSTQYNSSVSSYFFLEQRNLDPSCIVQPTTADEVSKVVKTFAYCPYTELAIRSGGHSPNIGFSNTNNGITLDLRGLNSIVLASDSKTVSVGTGNQWGDVYNKLDPLGKTVVGARVFDVGIGGFLSGGGISFFSPRDGFGCDNVQNFQVVLASGAIVNANAKENPLLFKALKGGQNNFGIITRFDLVIKPTARFWGGAVVTPESADPAQLDAFTKFKQAPYNPLLEIEQTFVYYGSQQSYFVSNNLFYLTASSNISSLDPFTSITPQLSSTLRISDVADFASEVEAGQPMNQFTVYATTTFPITSTNLKLIYALWKTTTGQLAAAIPEAISAMTYQSIPPPPPAGAPKNLFPFTDPSQTHPLVLLLISVYSPYEKDYTLLQQKSKQFITAVETLLNKPGNGGVSPYKYLNYAATWQDPISGYGVATVKEMKSTAAKYDPNGFFQKVVRGGYKLK
ncbi:FAD-binding domain-containing protein [Melanomma pulvis-pyrius CBS 109.77]|uniref:FAD-binding domain-containing protein n=1 Tax=Melanomma pulvis-pyrius CBS 109.77 TaxID=1314802 RepID=A0A6A6X033_9PLEO|nr:FAD-binding domain-containing protein [Melanomma pulvis-pyrius CBS 109.77]